MFRHPSYYKKLRERNKSGQVISTDRSRDKSSEAPIERSPGLGHKRQATSYKYPGPRPISNANKGLIHKRQASSSKRLKPQATSIKPQA